MSAANRKRGQRAEVAVVNYLRAQGWPDARRYLSGDGRQPGDIDWHPLICLEVKDVAASAWPTWCRQAAAEAPAGTVPVVVRRTRGAPDVGGWECRYADTPWDVATEWAMIATGLSYRVDDQWWTAITLGQFVAAVRAIDASPSPAGQTGEAS